jgi:hypothetical protein
MGDLLISALMVGDCSDRLCVYACRTWDFYDLEDQTKLLHTDLVLLDEEVCITYVEILTTLLIASMFSSCSRIAFPETLICLDME